MRVYKRRPVIDRILDQITVLDDEQGGCWIWHGGRNRGGYGRMLVHEDGRKRSRVTHRLVYEHFSGPVPDGLQLDHLCRVRHCCNPAHLEPVTASENVRRGPRHQRNVCYRGHDLTDENTYWEARGRRCKTCSDAYHKAYRAAHLEHLNARERERYHAIKARQAPSAPSI